MNRCDLLEHRTLLSAPDNYEQYALALLNRARTDPVAEATRYGITLNEGVASADYIQPTAKAPLAFNPLLIAPALSQSQYLLANDIFTHLGAGGTSPYDRMIAAGYTFNAPSYYGENIAYVGNSASYDPELVAINKLHQNLFVDSSIAGRGHRLEMLSTNYREVGIGVANGMYGPMYAWIYTSDFAGSAGNAFLTGTVYSDAVTPDGFYTPGEGFGGITITAVRQTDHQSFSTTTWSSGGYTLQLAPGLYNITASGPGMACAITYPNVVFGSQNILADFAPSLAPTVNAGVLAIAGTAGNDTFSVSSTPGHILLTIGTTTYDYTTAINALLINAGAGNDSVTLIGALPPALVYGGDGNDTIYGSSANEILYGDAGGDFIDGGAGNDSIYGGDGNDTIAGGWGNDTILGQNGNDQIHGGREDDQLTGGLGIDLLYGDKGRDVLSDEDGWSYIDGGPGVDMIYARNGARDTVVAGAGVDSAQIDSSVDIMPFADVETLLA